MVGYFLVALEVTPRESSTLSARLYSLRIIGAKCSAHFYLLVVLVSYQVRDPAMFSCRPRRHPANDQLEIYFTYQTIILSSNQKSMYARVCDILWNMTNFDRVQIPSRTKTFPIM